MYALRQSFVLLAVVALSTSVFGDLSGLSQDPPKVAKKMHGLVNKMTAVEGKRDELIGILLQGTKEMPGCLSYIVAKDSADETTIWVTEVWEDQASHKASLTLPAVREAMAKGKPLIAKFDQRVRTEPVGGHGLTPAKRSRSSPE
jgi:quinol monooxygenase YgiN